MKTRIIAAVVLLPLFFVIVLFLPKVFTGRLAAPWISEKKMMGITIIFSMFTRTAPKGERMETVLFKNPLP